MLKTLVSNYLDDDDDGEEGEMVITISKVRCFYLHWPSVGLSPCRYRAGGRYVKHQQNAEVVSWCCCCCFCCVCFCFCFFFLCFFLLVFFCCFFLFFP